MEQKAHDIRTLIHESAKGDAESSKKLYEHLVEKVYTYVRYRTSRDEYSTDITQDVFIDFFAGLHTFVYQSTAQLYAFVFVITKRKLARHYADMNIRGTTAQTSFDESVHLDTTHSHDEGTMHTHNFDAQYALSLLDEETREIMILHHYSEYTFGEIALLIDMNESAVRVRHHRALKSLAEKLST